MPEVATVKSSEERRAGEEDEEERLLYCVPTFDRALVKLCMLMPPSVDDSTAMASSSCCKDDVDGTMENTKAAATVVVMESPVQQHPNSFTGFGPTDAELRKFVADMEAVLGQGLGDSTRGTEERISLLPGSHYRFFLFFIHVIVDDGDSGR
jgi:hypothetical protein